MKFFFSLKPLLLILILISNKAFGFSISPMFIDMKPSGSEARSEVVVNNSSPHAMPVQASVAELNLDINGKVTSQPNKNFIVFPPQAIIRPHSRQAFRIQWRGNPNLPEGKAYELTISQVTAKDKRPSNNKEQTSIQLEIALAFGSVINMRAARGEPRPAIRSARLSRNKSGKPVLDVVASNAGNQNFLIAQADSTVKIFGSNNAQIWSYTYTPDEMRRNFGLGLVQPHKSRRMQIPLPNLPDHIARQAKSAKLEIRPSAQ